VTSFPTATAPLRPVRDGVVSPHESPPPPRHSRSAPTDGELMAGSLADPELFATVFDRHAVAVHGYLARRVGDLADDLLSETFLIAFRRRAAYQAVHAEVRPWLLGIATNVLHAHHRAERRRYRALARAAGRRDESPADPGESADRLSAQALRGPLAEALAGLAGRDRDVLLLIAWGELSYEEVAAVLDVPVGTVRSRLHRARRRTRAALAPALPEEETR